MKKKIGVYVDSGSSFATVIRAITQEVNSFCLVQAVVAGHLDRDDFFDDLNVFVMPGGADLPYCKSLNGGRNARLKRWVERGGVYLGLCAGAYYGCSEIVFNGYDQEIVGQRELGFLRGIAVGSIEGIAPLYDGTLKSAAVVSLIVDEGERIGSFYHGGPFFKIEEGVETKVLARYEGVEARPVAIVESSVGNGKALLCGVHPEMSAGELKIRIRSVDNSELEKEYSTRLLSALIEVDSRRRKFWRMLLERCGLELQ